MNDIIYLDNAATTYPKPKNVSAFLCKCCDRYGNPGRSSHFLSLNSAKAVFSCREIICSLFNFQNPENVVFTYNTTYALNMAIFGLCPDKGEILISNLEHNSVLRPVHELSQKSKGNISYKVFDALGNDEDVVKSFENTISPDTVMAVITACSNVTGKLLPVRKIGTVCKQKGIKLIIDAAQSAGIVPEDLQKQYFDAFCCAGHKSLYGIMGSGFCIFSKESQPKTLIFGGNGTASLSETQTTSLLPERLESGTLGVIPIACLYEGIKHIVCTGQQEIYEKCKTLSTLLTENLKNMPNISVIGECDNKTGTVLFNIRNKNSEKVCSLLSQKGICTRGGYHCASIAHKALGTAVDGGGVRASFSHFNSGADVKALTDALYEISKE